MNKIVNMTPHAIVVSNGNTTETFEPSGSIVRMEMISESIGRWGAFPISTSSVVSHNLPETVEGTYLLVSAMVLSAFPERKDLLAPDTNNATRNEKGHIVSVPGFIANKRG